MEGDERQQQLRTERTRGGQAAGNLVKHFEAVDTDEHDALWSERATSAALFGGCLSEDGTASALSMRADFAEGLRVHSTATCDEVVVPEQRASR